MSKEEKKEPNEKIILGIDPGTNVMGYALVTTEGKKYKILQYGVIHLKKYETHELKLKKIFERVTGIIDEFLPDTMALEAPFYGANVQSMLKLGRAQGVAMAAALAREIPITEYSPKKVKQSVTGNGNASKEQVAAMLQTLFNLTELPKMLDATDALAVALCHHFHEGRVQTRGRNEGWKSFIEDNPNRVKK
ncbi:Holliday junction endonuclease RuvC [Algoriphagus alkaliphilus]|uniref:Crossover junction endodeoxyribonuclease RuvC n=1 Tax=Algoriphagus alkaliphilus TaxID=279824 RepID=A0A1G5YTI3_9BACT|nr:MULTISPECIES: crossover junction endodeoxyribonuclease RuvC [Algoriphagus]MBA4301265.1 crossover junction endodeoxyribonuclease RuvC [Cyclobacterium sp.]MDP2042727.1 crossover junction endodeoxyribonuclease RuvC [Algoriphagus sp.]MDP3472494.1 crossover junction endodeoxyribonuclease RuvC [Algoriphagus sp.]SDA85826.1 Holliday junction endonuclease RuvC [Algoriphagus alkaliphilus]